MKSNNIISKLKSMLGHAIEVSFTHHEEITLRRTSGILMDVTDEYVYLKLYNDFGESTDYYLNRHSCQLVSIVDFGEPRD